jgi:hypothetical protein
MMSITGTSFTPIFSDAATSICKRKLKLIFQ